MTALRWVGFPLWRGDAATISSFVWLGGFVPSASLWSLCNYFSICQHFLQMHAPARTKELDWGPLQISGGSRSSPLCLSFPSPVLSFPSLPIAPSLVFCNVNSSFLVFLLELTLSSKLNHLVLPRFLCAMVRGFLQYWSLGRLFFHLSHVPRLQHTNALSFDILFLKKCLPVCFW